MDTAVKSASALTRRKMTAEGDETKVQSREDGSESLPTMYRECAVGVPLNTGTAHKQSADIERKSISGLRLTPGHRA